MTDELATLKSQLTQSTAREVAERAMIRDLIDTARKTSGGLVSATALEMVLDKPSPSAEAMLAVVCAAFAWQVVERDESASLGKRHMARCDLGDALDALRALQGQTNQQEAVDGE